MLVIHYRAQQSSELLKLGCEIGGKKTGENPDSNEVSRGFSSSVPTAVLPQRVPVS